MEEMVDILLKEKEVYEIVGFKQSKLRHMVIAGEFPAPMKLGNRNRWKQSVVNKWVEEAIEIDGNSQQLLSGLTA